MLEGAPHEEARGGLSQHGYGPGQMREVGDGEEGCEEEREVEEESHDLF